MNCLKNVAEEITTTGKRNVTDLCQKTYICRRCHAIGFYRRRSLFTWSEIPRHRPSQPMAGSASNILSDAGKRPAPDHSAPRRGSVGTRFPHPSNLDGDRKPARRRMGLPTMRNRAIRRSGSARTDLAPVHCRWRCTGVYETCVARRLTAIAQIRRYLTRQ